MRRTVLCLRRGFLLGVLLVLLVSAAACTDDAPAGQRPGDRTGEPSAGPGPVVDPAPSGEEPLVLATSVLEPPRRVDLATARALLSGADDRWPVVAAPGLALTGVPVARSARRAVRRAVRRPGTVAVLRGRDLDLRLRPVVVDGVNPVRRPQDYPLTLAGEDPPPVTRLTVVGDLMLTRGVSDPAAALAPLTPRLARADLTVGTLESTLSRSGAPQQGTDSFGADPEVVALLETAGFDALSLANNHVGDFEVPALLETVRLLRESTIVPFGAGRHLRAAGRAAVLERNGIRFGFLGFNTIGETPRATDTAAGALSVRMPPRTGPLAEGDLRHVERQVVRLAERVDVVVVLPHWGTQYTHRPEPIQRTVARRLARAGADLVVGGHPHWVQGLDLVGGTLVAHSLGNFVFDMDFMTQTQQGVVLEATFWGDRLTAFDLVPYRMDESFAPRVVRGDEATDILDAVRSTSTGPFRGR
ncbi:CapA family protein [Nocardioides sp.]|uniref:CapA family protein n=1 Tax=Nocardioides sp. TaxID=35761 RepID=UPI002732AFE1|nr:CapA family protein [Nocardioides sp.]MDP3893150.1 CapA family protein [Nocardioides sp.]